MRISILFLIQIFICQLSLGQECHLQFADEPATFQGGDIISFRENFLLPKIVYPDSAKQNCIQGRVTILFVVDTVGQINICKTIQSVKGGCDDEVIRVLLLSSGQWIPASREGKKVAIQYYVPVDFSLPRENCPEIFKLFQESQSLYDNRHYKEAIEKLDLLLSQAPLDKESLIMRGKCKNKIGDTNGACIDLRKVNNEESTKLIKKYCK